MNSENAYYYSTQDLLDRILFKTTIKLKTQQFFHVFYIVSNMKSNLSSGG